MEDLVVCVAIDFVNRLFNIVTYEMGHVFTILQVLVVQAFLACL